MHKGKIDTLLNSWYLLGRQAAGGLEPITSRSFQCSRRAAGLPRQRDVTDRVDVREERQAEGDPVVPQHGLADDAAPAAVEV